METFFLFMDEKYADDRAAPEHQVVSLTGLLVPGSAQREFRSRFRALLLEAYPAQAGVVPPPITVHAAALFPDLTDDHRFAFLEGIVRLVLDLKIELFRVGYRRTSDLLEVFRTERSVVGLCFAGMLTVLKPQDRKAMIWPVMEIDRTDVQDGAFAGLLQMLDHLDARLGPKSLTIDPTNLGEVLYVTKRSAHGAVVDCVAYLLHARYLEVAGAALRPFKQRLAQIASQLVPSIQYDEVIEMTVHK